MNLIPREPFKEIERFFGDDDWFLPVTRREKGPEMDLYETEEAIVAEVSAPGMGPEDLSVTVENNLLTVKGEKEEEKEDDEKGYYRREIRKGSFERCVRLPRGIDEEGVEATYEDGILKIQVPKTEKIEKTGKKVKIKKK